MRVTFFNELDSYALAGEMNSREIIDGVSLDQRIGSHYNKPSFGYGRFCLLKDTKQLLANYESTPQNIKPAIVEANLTRKDFLANQIIREHPRNVGIYRWVMMTGSDNFRNSSIFGIMKPLRSAGIKLIVYEPRLIENNSDYSQLEHDLNVFKNKSDHKLPNRVTHELADVRSKVFSRYFYRINKIFVQ